MVKKLLIVVFFLAFSLLLPVKNLQAAEEFATSYDVTYDIGEDGMALVTEKITLRNLTSQFYATQFKLTIGATQITDVKASDGGGVLETKIEQKDSSTTISVKFNAQVVGLNKELSWTLQFKSKDFAQKIGKVWEVSVPKVASGTNIERYDVTLSIPQTFKGPTGISPAPIKESSAFGKTFFSFSREQLQNSGVSASFGDNQVFDFNLTYNLENTSLVPIVTSIALPPDTAYQDVALTRIEPKPIQVSLDDDGNFLAWYRLSRNQKLSIKVIGSAKLYSSSKVKNPSLDQGLKEKYLKSEKFWEKDNPTIKTTLGEILGTNPPQSNIEKARLIHRFVVNRLKYDSSRLSDSGIERLGAVTALSNPTSAVCMEFTDLFIALARAAGIPARELDGYAYTSNLKLRPLSLTKDILHAWPEFWDDNKGWTMIDPTWENTTGGVDYFSKLDLNHFVFAVKGVSPEYPAPAGSYKYTGEDSKDVKVYLSEVDFVGKPQLDVDITSSNALIAGFPATIKVRFTNLGNSIFVGDAFSLQAAKIAVEGGEGRKLGPIPPFGYSEFTFAVKPGSLFDSFEDIITINLANQRYEKNISVKPFIHSKIFPFIVGGTFGLILLIYLGILAGYFYKKRQANVAQNKLKG